MFDPDKIDPAIPGWVGPEGDGIALTGGENFTNYINPVVNGRAIGYRDYLSSDTINLLFGDLTRALGSVWGQDSINNYVVSLSGSDLAFGFRVSRAYRNTQKIISLSSLD